MLAIDIGFSGCKCKTAKNEWKFPSFISPGSEQTVDLGDGPSGYKFRGTRYKVGNPGGDGGSGAKYVRNIEYLLEFGPLFVAHAIKSMGTMPQVLAVGLPLEQYLAYRDAMRNALMSFEVNGNTYRFDVRVFPQAVGALAQYRQEANPPAGENGFLVDIGFNTTIVLKYQDLKARSEGSTQYNQFGISRALEDLGAVIKSRHGQTLSPLELNDVFLKGYLQKFGTRVSLENELHDVISNHVDTLMKTLRDDYDRHLMRSDRLVMAGGGARHINGQLPEQYREFCLFLDSPEFANVRGYWMLAGGGQQ